MQLKYPSVSKNIFYDAMQDDLAQKYLGALRKHHEDTYRHSCRVALLSIDIGLENTIVGQGLKDLALGALLHDIGKLQTPTAILDKGGELDECERLIIKNHPRDGFDELQNVSHTIRYIVVSHHEWKKDSYPRKLHRVPLGKEEILAEIVAAADIFDTLASRRSYKPPFSRAEIEQGMEEQFLGSRQRIAQALDLY